MLMQELAPAPVRPDRIAGNPGCTTHPFDAASRS